MERESHRLMWFSLMASGFVLLYSLKWLCTRPRLSRAFVAASHNLTFPPDYQLTQNFERLAPVKIVFWVFFIFNLFTCLCDIFLIIQDIYWESIGLLCISLLKSLWIRSRWKYSIWKTSHLWREKLMMGQNVRTKVMGQIPGNCKAVFTHKLPHNYVINKRNILFEWFNEVIVV